MAARHHYGPHYVCWTPAELAIMQAEYATSGGAALARTLLPTRSPGKIRDKASQLGLYYVPQGPKPPKPRAKRPYTPRAKKAPVLRPAKEAAPAVPRPVAVRRAVGTPNLHARKAETARSVQARKVGVLYTADEVRTQFKPGHPLRTAYTFGGDAGVRAYLSQQPPT